MKVLIKQAQVIDPLSPANGTTGIRLITKTRAVMEKRTATAPNSSFPPAGSMFLLILPIRAMSLKKLYKPVVRQQRQADIPMFL